ncbi:Diacetylchitobiose uptake system permease protein DasC [subsurface metagenome]
MAKKEFKLMQKFKTLNLYLYAMIFLMIIVIAFPLYWMVLTSFQPTTQATSYPPFLFFKSFSLEKIKWIITNTKIIKWIMNSLLVSLGVVFMNLLVSVPAAYSIAKFRIKFNNILLLVVLVTQMIPQAIMVVPLFEIFKSINLINNLFSVILANIILTLPLGTWILIGFFENIPSEIEEAAVIDGASRTMLFFKISLPLTYPAMITVAIITFFDAWNEYMYGYTFIYNQDKWVGTVGIASFIGQFLTDWQAIMTSSLLFSFIPMTVYIFFRKYIVRGVSEGFAKG